jgi:predicted enzyme related to lactoylglutathione lyase
MTDETTAADIMAFTPRPALLPRLSLVVIRAADPAQLARFYSALGMSFQPEQHGAGPLHYVSTDTGITFEIYPRSAEEPPTTGTRLGFATVALDVVLNALTEYGGEIVAPARVSPWGRRAVVIDPEGHKVEISEQGAVLDGEGRLTDRAPWRGVGLVTSSRSPARLAGFIRLPRRAA